MRIQTILYGPCQLPDHTDCTTILRWHEGRPTSKETERYDVERDAREHKTTYRLTIKKVGV